MVLKSVPGEAEAKIEGGGGPRDRVAGCGLAEESPQGVKSDGISPNGVLDDNRDK